MAKRRSVEEVLQILLPEIGNVKEVGNNAWKGACPLHDDTSLDSVSFGVEDSGNLVLHCFAGCSTPSIFYHYGIAMQRRTDWEKAGQSAPTMNVQFNLKTRED